jgi:signal transduction histidine kinase
LKVELVILQIPESHMPHEGGERPQNLTGDAESSDISTADSDCAPQLAGDTSAGRRDEELKMCGVLGLWTSKDSSVYSDRAPVIPLTEAFLQTLLHKYPHGHVFQPGDRGRAMSPSRGPGHAPGDEAGTEYKYLEKRDRHPNEVAERREAKILLRMLPGARSVAFVPLWDSHRERWFAGSFIWAGQETARVLTHTEDLNYLTAFGNSIMAEVARLDVVDADRAKSDFISSVSHELRSPLHGILASVEFLQDTTLSSFQLGMIDTIERCGITLLDTIQHVLDFTKINTFTRSDRNERSKPGPGGRRSGPEESSLSVDVDLSLLTEDVIDSVFAGHEFHVHSSLQVVDEARSSLPETTRRNSTNARDDTYTVPNQPGSTNDRLEVVMDIGWRPNWTFNTQSGALRRILMNLFGNALKYTSRGWVKVSLQAQDIESTSSKPDQSVVTITVSDSGRGISQEYLHSGLFTPFTQENPMNQGTGLGLSTVLQIVGSLGGTIDITSDQGVGTEVMVTLTLNQASSADHLPLRHEGGNVIQTARAKTAGLTIGLQGFDVNPAIPERCAVDPEVEPKPATFLQTSLSGMAKHWFDMKVLTPQTTLLPDIYVTNE